MTDTDTSAEAAQGALIRMAIAGHAPDVNLVMTALTALAAERDALRLSVAEARNAALDEAGKIAMLAYAYHETGRKSQLSLGNTGNAEHRSTSMATARVIHADILALKTTPKGE